MTHREGRHNAETSTLDKCMSIHVRVSGALFQYQAESGRILAIASVRLATPSLMNVFSRCLRTVPGDRPSWRAIAWLVSPAATSCRVGWQCRQVPQDNTGIRERRALGPPGERAMRLTGGLATVELGPAGRLAARRHGRLGLELPRRSRAIGPCRSPRGNADRRLGVMEDYASYRCGCSPSCSYARTAAGEVHQDRACRFAFMLRVAIRDRLTVVVPR